MGASRRSVGRRPERRSVALAGFAIALLLAPGPVASAHRDPGAVLGTTPTTSPGPVANFTAALNRLVELVGLAGSAILTLVWARVALSWFSNDLTKKIQAKDRARDALVGTLLFVAAVSGLVWALAHWVVTGA